MSVVSLSFRDQMCPGRPLPHRNCFRSLCHPSPKEQRTVISIWESVPSTHRTKSFVSEVPDQNRVPINWSVRPSQLLTIRTLETLKSAHHFPRRNDERLCTQDYSPCYNWRMIIPLSRNGLIYESQALVAQVALLFCLYSIITLY